MAKGDTLSYSSGEEDRVFLLQGTCDDTVGFKH